MKHLKTFLLVILLACNATASVRFDASTDQLSRTNTMPTITAFTFMCWVKVSVDRNAFSCFINFHNSGSGSGYYYMGTDSDGTTFALYNNSTVVAGSALTVGTWYHVAMVCSGTGAGQFLGYLNGALNITHAGNAAQTAGGIWVGATNEGTSLALNGSVAAIKIYSAALSAADIQRESKSYRPKRTANLNGWYPCTSIASDEIDFSGAGLTFSQGGTLATEDGPPISWK